MDYKVTQQTAIFMFEWVLTFIPHKKKKMKDGKKQEKKSLFICLLLLLDDENK